MTDLEPARLGWRLGARVVDLAVLGWIANFLIVEIDQRLLGGDPLGRRPIDFDLSLRGAILLVVAVVGYEVVPVATRGATLGKAVLGLRMVGGDAGATPSVGAALGRAVVLYGGPIALGPYGSIVWLVLLVSLAVPASGRGLHDRLFDTTVVAARRPGE